MTANPPASPNSSVSLREFIQEQLRAHMEVHKADQAAAAAAASFQKTAIDLAAEAQKEWRAAANEWRAAMTDRERNFATHAEYQSNAKRLDALEDANIRREERDRLADQVRSRQQWTVGIMVAIAAIVISALVSLAIHGLH